MAKRCAKCEYKLDDMCRFWQCWRKDSPLNFCSEKMIKRAVSEGVLQYRSGGLGGGNRVIDKMGLLLIIRYEFNHPDLVFS